MPAKIDAVLKRIEEQQQLENIVVPDDASPLDFLMAIYRDHRQPMNRRLRAAIEAAPYTHAKLAVTASVKTQDLAALLDARIQKIREAQPKLINADQRRGTPAAIPALLPKAVGDD
jgi:hypothetical protein